MHVELTYALVYITNEFIKNNKKRDYLLYITIMTILIPRYSFFKEISVLVSIGLEYS